MFFLFFIPAFPPFIILSETKNLIASVFILSRLSGNDIVGEWCELG